jgi:pimeloyl-ACP methyl ester carboxylesterase
MKLKRPTARRVWRVIALFACCIAFCLCFPVPKAPSKVGNHLTVSGTDISYDIRSGRKGDIVFLHGSEGSMEDFRLSPIWHELPGYRLIALDRPGRDTSSAGKYSVERQVSLIHEFLTRLAVHQPVLVAHSWSGALAMAYALRYPGSVKAIVLIAGWTYPVQQPLPDGGGYALAPGIGPMVSQGAYWSRISETDSLLKQGFGSFPIPFAMRRQAEKRWFWSREQVYSCLWELRDANRWLIANSGRYSSISVPVIAIAGDRDTDVPPDQAKRIAMATGGRSILLAGQGHYLQFTASGEVGKAIMSVVR